MQSTFEPTPMETFTKSTGTISTWLARFSYDVYPAVALIFLVVLLTEVVRPPSTKTQEAQVATDAGQSGKTADVATAAPVVLPLRDGFGGRSTS